MSDDPKYSGVGPHGTMPSLYGGKSRDEMMAEFKAGLKDTRRVVDFDPPPKDTKPKDYPWMKPGWKG
jgi:hypothetical protein